MKAPKAAISKIFKSAQSIGQVADKLAKFPRGEDGNFVDVDGTQIDAHGNPIESGDGDGKNKGDNTGIARGDDADNGETSVDAETTKDKIKRHMDKKKKGAFVDPGEGRTDSGDQIRDAKNIFQDGRDAIKAQSPRGTGGSSSEQQQALDYSANNSGGSSDGSGSGGGFNGGGSGDRGGSGGGSGKASDGFVAKPNGGNGSDNHVHGLRNPGSGGNSTGRPSDGLVAKPNGNNGGGNSGSDRVFGLRNPGGSGDVGGTGGVSFSDRQAIREGFGNMHQALVNNPSATKVYQHQGTSDLNIDTIESAGREIFGNFQYNSDTRSFEATDYNGSPEQLQQFKRTLREEGFQGELQLDKFTEAGIKQYKSGAAQASEAAGVSLAIAEPSCSNGVCSGSISANRADSTFGQQGEMFAQNNNNQSQQHDRTSFEQNNIDQAIG